MTVFESDNSTQAPGSCTSATGDGSYISNNEELKCTLPFIPEGDDFKVEDIFKLPDPFNITVVWIHFPKNLSEPNLSDISTEKSAYEPSRYDVELHYGPYKWVLRRTKQDLLNLEQAIQVACKRFRTKHFDMPSFARYQSNKKHENVPQISDIRNKNKVQAYLQTLMSSRDIQCLPYVLNFFEISPLTFCLNLGTSKFLEGEILLRKKVADTNDGEGHWRRRWLILKDTYLLIIKPHKVLQRKDQEVEADGVPEGFDFEAIKHQGRKLKRKFEEGLPDLAHIFQRYRRWRFCQVLLMDPFFSRQITNVGDVEALKVSNMHSEIIFAPSLFNSVDTWNAAMNKVQSLPPAAAYLGENPHSSFAPVRTDTQMIVGIDGAAYMNAVADALEAARYEIFITDWWLSPEIPLKRPRDSDYWRLDNLLKRKAEQGVRICVLLYKEIKFCLSINSLHSKESLTSLHRNIHVIRHPSHIRDHTLNWSHHEKMVVIDQSVVFMGGIDLCYGRWDIAQHPVLDLPGRSPNNWPADSGYKSSSTSKTSAASRPSREQSIATEPLGCLHTSATSPGAKLRPRSMDASLQQRRKINSQITEPSEDVAFDVDESDDLIHDSSVQNHLYSRHNTPGRPRRKFAPRRADQRSVPSERSGVPSEEPFLFPAKDYNNCIYKDLTELDKPELMSIDRNSIPRMPWHDLGVGLSGEIVADFARHFIQRWNAHRVRKTKRGHKRPSISRIPPLLIPTPPANPELAARLHELGGGGSCAHIPKSPLVTQALRSAGHWSLGVGKSHRRRSKSKIDDKGSTWSLNTSVMGLPLPSQTESSIQEAYVEAIRNAEHFIYIENQFFISYVQHSDYENIKKYPQNRIAQAIYERVVRAHREKEPFRVFIILPLLPGFEGIAGDKKSGVSMHTIIRYTQDSLFKGPTSLLQRLELEVPDVNEYVSVCGLRNHDRWPNGQFTTELIYVHDKIMIVDDRKLIVGSANINDRSMLGNRDSELALIVDDTQAMEASKDGRGGVVAEIRRKLMSEHLGGNLFSSTGRKLLFKPTSDEFFHGLWQKTARNNMDIYDEVFNCKPSNSIQTFIDNASPLSDQKVDNDQAKQKLSRVRGHLCEFPQDFLIEEDLSLSVLAKEKYVATVVWI